MNWRALPSPHKGALYPDPHLEHKSSRYSSSPAVSLTPWSDIELGGPWIGHPPDSCFQMSEIAGLNHHARPDIYQWVCKVSVSGFFHLASRMVFLVCRGYLTQGSKQQGMGCCRGEVKARGSEQQGRGCCRGEVAKGEQCEEADCLWILKIFIFYTGHSSVPLASFFFQQICSSKKKKSE